MKLITIAAVLFCLLPAIANACPEANGLIDNNCDGRVIIVCFGDSITFGRRDTPTEIGYPGRLRAFFPNAEVYNLGLPGENTFAGNARSVNTFSQIQNADYVILLEGINDYYTRNKSADVTRDNLLSILRRARNTGAVSFLAKLTDVKRVFQKNWVKSVNNRLVNLAQIDFFSLGTNIISFDLLHPNSIGYDRMGLKVAQLLQQHSAINRPADTDLDGIYDYYEARIGTNHLIADSDGDGLSDGAEVFQHKSSPLVLDTDNDGLTDPYEVSLGSNPANPNPTPPKLKSFRVL